MHPDLQMASDRLLYQEAKHYRGKVCIHGHDHGGFSWRHLGHRNCVDCTRDRARSWRAENPERAAASTKRRDAMKSPERRKRWPIAIVCGGARARSREEGLDYNITPDILRQQWKDQGGLCYWTAIAMTFDDNAAPRHPLKPSLDRIDPTVGYVAGNVVWATNFANRARSDCPAEEFARVMDTVCAAFGTGLPASRLRFPA